MYFSFERKDNGDVPVFTGTAVELTTICPQFQATLSRLGTAPHELIACTGANIGNVLPSALHRWPMMVVSSERFDAASVVEFAAQEPFIFLDGSEWGFHASTYLGWNLSERVALAVDMFELNELISEAERPGRILVLAVADGEFALSYFRVDKEFLDFCYVASRVRYIERFIPSESYFEAFLEPLSVGSRLGERFVLGPSGEPAYVLVVVEENPDAG